MTIKYPYLPEGREIKYVGEDNFFMFMAKKIRNDKSTDTNHPTGAVIVKENKIIGEWANQSALKNKWLIAFHKKGWCLRKFLGIKTGEKYWLCPGCSNYKYHAESGAIKDATKKGFDTKGADLYLYGHWWCCKPCWDTIIKAGIKDVYLLENAKEKFDSRNF